MTSPDRIAVLMCMDDPPERAAAKNRLVHELHKRMDSAWPGDVPRAPTGGFRVKITDAKDWGVENFELEYVPEFGDDKLPAAVIHGITISRDMRRQKIASILIVGLEAWFHARGRYVASVHMEIPNVAGDESLRGFWGVNRTPDGSVSLKKATAVSGTRGFLNGLYTYVDDAHSVVGYRPCMPPNRMTGAKKEFAEAGNLEDFTEADRRRAILAELDNAQRNAKRRKVSAETRAERTAAGDPNAGQSPLASRAGTIDVDDDREAPVDGKAASFLPLSETTVVCMQRWWEFSRRFGALSLYGRTQVRSGTKYDPDYAIPFFATEEYSNALSMFHIRGESALALNCGNTVTTMSYETVRVQITELVRYVLECPSEERFRTPSIPPGFSPWRDLVLFMGVMSRDPVCRDVVRMDLFTQSLVRELCERMNTIDGVKRLAGTSVHFQEFMYDDDDEGAKEGEDDDDDDEEDELPVDEEDEPVVDGEDGNEEGDGSDASEI
jgi:hypothetical protein